MKILYDQYGFIWATTTTQNTLDAPDGYFTDIITSQDDINKLVGILEPGYGYPLFKYTDGVITKITNYDDYNVSMTILRNVLDKRRHEFSEMIEKSTLDELRTLFHSLNASDQLQFRKCFSEYWATGASTQTDINLCFEGLFRVLIKALYIKDVLKRELTVDEENEYHQMLTIFYNHNELIEPYLPTLTWSLPLVERVMREINDVRFDHVFPKLGYITTPPEV